MVGILAYTYKGDTISQNATQGRSALHSLNSRMLGKEIFVHILFCYAIMD